MAEAALVFPEEWVVQIKEIVNNHENSQSTEYGILRVARPLLNVNVEAYFPQVFSLGPYHHGKIEKDTNSSSWGGKISRAEVYKAKSAATLSQILSKSGKKFDSIVEIMDRRMPEIARFYHWGGKCSKNFAVMMAVDSSFLLCFLLSMVEFLSIQEPKNPPDTDRSRSSAMVEFVRLYTFYPCIKDDVLKLENQIPLFVLTEVFENVKKDLTSISEFKELSDFKQLLMKTFEVKFRVFSPFYAREICYDKICDDKVANGSHLLGCIHAFVSQFLVIDTAVEDKRGIKRKILDLLQDIAVCVLSQFPRLKRCLEHVERPLLKAFCARDLDEAGINLVSFSKLPEKIRLDKYFSTLYLPTIFVSDIHTEVFLRNLVALEFNNVDNPDKPVTRYVGLMGCLIQSPDDVRLLIDRGIILRGDAMLTDQLIFNMWKGVSQPLLTLSVRYIYPEFGNLVEDLLMKNSRRTKIKRAIYGIIDFVSTLKFFGSLAAVLGLIMTAIQTYCSLRQL